MCRLILWNSLQTFSSARKHCGKKLLKIKEISTVMLTQLLFYLITATRINHTVIWPIMPCKSIWTYNRYLQLFADGSQSWQDAPVWKVLHHVRLNAGAYNDSEIRIKLFRLCNERYYTWSEEFSGFVEYAICEWSGISDRRDAEVPIYSFTNLFWTKVVTRGETQVTYDNFVGPNLN